MSKTFFQFRLIWNLRQYDNKFEFNSQSPCYVGSSLVYTFTNMFKKIEREDGLHSEINLIKNYPCFGVVHADWTCTRERANPALYGEFALFHVPDPHQNKKNSLHLHKIFYNIDQINMIPQLCKLRCFYWSNDITLTNQHSLIK